MMTATKDVPSKPSTEDSLLLERILQPGALPVVFQPIFEVRQEALRLHSLEALSRGPSGTQLESADALFGFIRSQGAEIRADQVITANVLNEARLFPGTPTISINVHASTLAKDKDFPRYLGDRAQENGVKTSRITVEIVEHSLSECDNQFYHNLKVLGDMGIRIALDDMGAGDSNSRRALDWRPDY